MAEPDASPGAVRRGDGRGFVACLAALVGADAPRTVPAFSPLGGQGQVLGHRLAEIIGDLVDEPPVEQITFTLRVGGGPLRPAVWGGEILVFRFGISSARVEVDRKRGSWFGVSSQRLVDRVVKASGEGLAVLPAGDEDDGLPWFESRNLHLPGAVFPAEHQCLAVHAG